MTILNLTQHAATPDQIEAGVVDLPPEVASIARALLTFDECPDAVGVTTRAHDLAGLVYRHIGTLPESARYNPAAMIGGAPYLMAPLSDALRVRGIRPLFAFSRRESVEETQPDGTVRKVAVFRHAGWVPAV